MTKILRFTSAPVAVLLVLLTVITMVSGVTTLFIHYFPAVPPTSTMTTACGAEYLSPNPTTVQEGSSGQISFRCSDANPAFTISGGVFSAMPDFSYYGSFPAPYSTLWIYQSDGAVTTGACADRTAARQLESRTIEVDMAPFNYNYCAEYANVGSGGLPAFTVYWFTVPGNVLFYHLAPAVPTPATMTSTCANSSLIANPSAVDPGSTGQISFQCSDTTPAFTISGGTFSAIPYFDGSGFAAPYTTLWIYQSDGGTTTGGCTGRTGARQLTSGVTAADIAPLNYSYCAEYANVGGGGLPAFYVYWTTT